MTRDFIADDITTQDEFDAALGQLLAHATRIDIDPRGSWIYRNGQNAPDWEVMVYELEKEDGDMETSR